MIIAVTEAGSFYWACQNGLTLSQFHLKTEEDTALNHAIIVIFSSFYIADVSLIFNQLINKFGVIAHVLDSSKNAVKSRTVLRTRR
jgi:hypothetical protein